jgi:hypothetical protein
MINAIARLLPNSEIQRFEKHIRPSTPSFDEITMITLPLHTTSANDLLTLLSFSGR